MVPVTILIGFITLIIVGHNVRVIRSTRHRNDGSATMAAMWIIIAVAFFLFTIFSQVANNHPIFNENTIVKERYQGSTLYFDNENKEYFQVDNNLMSFDHPFEKRVIPDELVKSGEWKEGRT